MFNVKTSILDNGSNLSSSSLKTGIVAGIAGGIIFIVFTIIVIVCAKRRKQKSRENNDDKPGNSY